MYGGGRVDRVTGEVWPQVALDSLAESGGDEDQEDDDDDRWLWVESEGSRDGYRDMEWFISVLDEPKAAERLGRAIDGRRPFRRFSDELDRWPDLIGPWLAFSDERKRGRARAWLADQGYAAELRVLGS